MVGSCYVRTQLLQLSTAGLYSRSCLIQFWPPYHWGTRSVPQLSSPKHVHSEDVTLQYKSFGLTGVIVRSADKNSFVATGSGSSQLRYYRSNCETGVR
eukprot:309931-Amphidinium_carterae.1